MRHAGFFLFIVAALYVPVLGATELPVLQHVRFHPDFLKQPEASPGPAAGAQLPWLRRLVPVLFDQEVASSRLHVRAATAPQNSLLYQQIHRWLGDRHVAIGQQEANQVAQFNQQFNMGSQNFSGFRWQRPFGAFSLYVDRQVSPDLFDDARWIVMDTFTVNVEAASFLGKLNEAGVVDMTEAEIAAFAGITFRRTYTTYHFATGFLAGLTSDYSRLFLPFLLHTPENALGLGDGTVIKRQDTWSVAAGGLIESPSAYGMSFSAGALAEATHDSLLTVQHIPPRDAARPGENIRVSHRSTLRRSAGVSAGLQLDFFKLLQFTLLSHDLEYGAEASKSFYLSFRPEDREKLLGGEPEASAEFAGLLQKNSPDIRWLEPWVVRLDEGSTALASSQSMLLLWGTLKKASLEQVRVIKDQVLRTFFRSHSESVRLVQNFWSRLFSGFLFRLFSFNAGVKTDASTTRALDIEYEATLPQSADPQQMLLEKHEQFSLVLSLTYQAARTDRWRDRQHKKDAETFLARYTNLPANFRTMVRNKELRGPLKIDLRLRVMGDGLAWFAALPDAEVESVFRGVCGKRPLCFSSLANPFRAYKRVLAGTGRHELARLKELFGALAKEARDTAPYRALFGEYAFFHGNFRATSRSGMGFSTPFTSGQFRGLSLIDTYDRLNGTRGPASVGEE